MSAWLVLKQMRLGAKIYKPGTVAILVDLSDSSFIANQNQLLYIGEMNPNDCIWLFVNLINSKSLQDRLLKYPLIGKTSSTIDQHKRIKSWLIGPSCPQNLLAQDQHLIKKCRCSNKMN